MRIAFLWEGVTEFRYRLTDGLGLALELLKQKHEIRYFEPYDAILIHGFKPDVILHWAPLCGNDHFPVINLPYKKAIAFGGGPIEPNNVDGYDLYFTESAINEKEFTHFGKPWMRAFGINEQIFKPENLEKKYDGCFAGTFARWKRPELFAKAVGSRGIAVGLHQKHEKECYEVCLEEGLEVHDEISREQIATFINQSHTVVNPSDLWGGGQRLTLEAMACNVPPIVMSDSPKNIEYVEESGFGLIVDPNVEAIKEAISSLKGKPCNSREYILEKFSIQKYADALEKGLSQL